MNTEQARANMIARQIRTYDVLDASVLATFQTLRREAFVPPAYKALAFADMELPLGYGQVMLEPKLEARFLRELEIRPTDRVLEIGSGSGFMAALLAAHAKSVLSLEIEPALAEMAQRNLSEAGITNVQVNIADGAEHTATDGAWDVIMISGAIPSVPENLLLRLQPGGRLAAIVGTAPAMQMQIITATPDGFRTKCPLETETTLLKNFAASAFSF